MAESNSQQIAPRLINPSYKLIASANNAQYVNISTKKIFVQKHCTVFYFANDEGSRYLQISGENFDYMGIYDEATRTELHVEQNSISFYSIKIAKRFFQPEKRIQDLINITFSQRNDALKFYRRMKLFVGSPIVPNCPELEAQMKFREPILSEHAFFTRQTLADHSGGARAAIQTMSDLALQNDPLLPSIDSIRDILARFFDQTCRTHRLKEHEHDVFKTVVTYWQMNDKDVEMSLKPMQRYKSGTDELKSVEPSPDCFALFEYPFNVPHPMKNEGGKKCKIAYWPVWTKAGRNNLKMALEKFMAFQDRRRFPQIPAVSRADVVPTYCFMLDYISNPLYGMSFKDMEYEKNYTMVRPALILMPRSFLVDPKISFHTTFALLPSYLYPSNWRLVEVTLVLTEADPIKDPLAQRLRFFRIHELEPRFRTNLDLATIERHQQEHVGWGFTIMPLMNRGNFTTTY